MSLSPAKFEILEALLLYEKPVKAAEVAKELEKERKVVQMHLIGLVKLSLANSPAKGEYLISEKGKSMLSLPEIDKDSSVSILSRRPHDKAFHFYAGMGKPLHVYAYDMKDFCSKIPVVSSESVGFHVERGDFEAWFKMLGDLELAKKTAVLKNRKLTAEQLRLKLLELVESRCTRLSEKAGHAAPST